MDGRRLSELTRLPDAVPRVRSQPRPLPRSWALAVGAGVFATTARGVSIQIARAISFGMRAAYVA